MGKDKEIKPSKVAAAKSTPRKPQDAAPQSKIWQDERFQHLVADPRFRSLPKAQRKVKIDKRFQSMFSDAKFKVKYTVDKYGRRVNKSTSEDLKKYYELEGSSDSENEAVADQGEKAKEHNIVESVDDIGQDEDEEQERRKEELAISRDADADIHSACELEPGDNDELASDGEELPKTLRQRLTDPNVDYARGEGRLITDSSSDDESSDEEDPEMYIDHVWGELDAEADMTDASTRRLAVCNMDWDRVRAVDLLVLFTSFVPPGGSVLSVKIYPSEFGKSRLAEEERHGPPELVGLGKTSKVKQANMKTAKSNKAAGANAEMEPNSDADSEPEDELVQEQDSDAGEGDDYHMEKLRQYQLNRLRYYYAVVECDSEHTADKIYRECDGNEYESSATRVDLRFVPDETSFDDDEPTDVCTELPEINNYKPRQFTTTALQQVKVDLTWDETAVERRELGDKLSSGKLDEISDKELRKIVAYSSEEDESDTEEADAEQEKGRKLRKKLKKIKMESDNCSATVTDIPKKKKEDVISKYKALLMEINEDEQKEKAQKKYEMEFSWDVAAEAQTKDDKDLDDGASKSKAKAQMTPIEKVLQKRSEKNKKRKEERKRMKLKAQGIDVDELNSESDIDSIPDGIDMNDPYFAEEFANGDFVETNSKKQQKGKSKHKPMPEADIDQEEEDRQAKELQLLLDDDDELEQQGKQHFSLEKIQKAEEESKSKKKRRTKLKKSKSALNEAREQQIVDTFQINVNDARFTALYKSHHFNIDPTDSHYKKTKAMEQLIHEKLKRRHGEEGEEPVNSATANGREQVAPETEQTAKRPRKQLENALLVKSLKRKLQAQNQSNKLSQDHQRRTLTSGGKTK